MLFGIILIQRNYCPPSLSSLHSSRPVSLLFASSSPSLHLSPTDPPPLLLSSSCSSAPIVRLVSVYTLVVSILELVSHIAYLAIALGTSWNLMTAEASWVIYFGQELSASSSSSISSTSSLSSPSPLSSPPYPPFPLRPPPLLFYHSPSRSNALPSGAPLDYIRHFGPPVCLLVATAVIVAALNARNFYPLIPPARVKPTSLPYKAILWFSFLLAAVSSATLLSLGYLLAWIILFFLKGVFQFDLTMKRKGCLPPHLLFHLPSLLNSSLGSGSPSTST